MTLASLLIPAIRWDHTHGFENQRRTIDESLVLGVGGFVIHGGERVAVAELTAELHARSGVPLLIAAEAERGAGQQFAGCVSLPPLGALGMFENGAAMRRAAQITARDLRRLGVNWALAPVCELDLEPADALIGTRAAGHDVAQVGALVAEWIDGCQPEGVMACAKSFPGNHTGPFTAAIDAGVASIMMAGAPYPRLDASGAAANVSSKIVSQLRDGFEFDGLVACDAPDADAVRALNAGCDVLLAPSDVSGTVRALDAAARRGEISADRVREAIESRDRWAAWARPSAGREPSLDDEVWSRQVADASVHLVRGVVPRVGHAVEVVLIDDDAGIGHTPNRAHFASALRELDIEANVLHVGSSGTRVPVLIAAFADVVAGKPGHGFTHTARERITKVLDVSREQRRETLVVLFSHPRHAAQLAGAPNVLCAWGGEPPMQAAAARVIARGQFSG